MKKNILERTLAVALSAGMLVTMMPQGIMAAADETAEVAVTAPAADSETIADAFAVPDEKPGVRFWLPGGMIEEEALRADIKDIADLGYGRVEVCSLDFFTANIASDYAWGTENWNKAMEIIVDEAKKYDMEVDFNNGNAYPIQMPGVDDADDEGSSYEVTFAQATVNAGETLEGELPQRRSVRVAGTTKIVSAYAYKSTDDKLDAANAIDLTPYITVNEEDQQASTISWTAPEDGTYEIYIFFEQPTCQSGGSFGQTAEGTYVVDHFGAAGAEAMTEYWTELFTEYPDLTYASNIFSDSIEIFADNEWTRDFVSIFQEQEGYDIRPYLPALGAVTYYNSTDGPAREFTEDGLSEEVYNDYREVLTYCFEEYHLKPLRELAEKFGLDTRYQVAYNLPTDMVSSALYVGTPENEGTSMEQLRMMTAAAHNNTEGSGLASIEVGFESGNTYGQTYEDLMWRMKRAWAAGINYEVLHGASYSGNFSTPIMTFPPVNGAMAYWPGYAAWSSVVSNLWNRNTSAENAEAMTTYIARNNYVLQKESKIDLAVFREEYEDAAGNSTEPVIYNDGGTLLNNGYSYDYVDTEILNLENMTVKDGLLNADGTAYKAIILNKQKEISYAAAEKIQALAEAGLPVVIVGDAPSELKYYSDKVKDGHTDAELAQIFTDLLENYPDTVKQAADYDAVPEVLSSMNIAGDAVYNKETEVVTRHTTDGVGEYYYLYNYSQETSYPAVDKSTFTEEDVEVTLSGEGRPYTMDAWSGEITAISDYTLNADDTVTVPLHFYEDEAKLIVLLTDEEAAANGIATEAPAVVGKTYADVAIDQWNLQISSISQGDTIYFRDSKWTDLEAMTVTELKPWAELNEEWTNISGIGTYTAEFTLDHGWDEGYGAYLNVGEVGDTFTVEVNGTQLPTVDQISGKIDIGKYVHSGKNTVVIKVASTMYNAVFGSVNAYEGYGLLGTDGKVTVTPYALEGCSVEEKLAAAEAEKAQLKAELDELKAEIATLKAALKASKAETAALKFQRRSSKISALKAGKKLLRVSVKKVTGADGYQVKYAFTKSLKNAKTFTTKKTSAVIKGLKSGRTYFVKARAYKIVGSSKVYTAYSSVKSVKIR